MSYLYRRQRGIIDLLINRLEAKKILIRDGADGEGGEYVVVINDVGFRAIDPDSDVDSSVAIATSLANDINASQKVRVEATVTGNSIRIIPERPAIDVILEFALEVSTTDDGGNITHKSIFPTEYIVKQADNWDDPFVEMERVPQGGLASESVKREDSGYFSKKKSVRFRFNPKDYDLIEDDIQFFRIAPVLGGDELADSRIITVPGYLWYQQNQPPLPYIGTPPEGTSIEDSVTFILPAQSSSFNFDNVGANTVYLSFGTGPGEIPVEPGGGWSNNSIGIKMFSVRSEGGPSEISAVPMCMTHHE